jgi:catechol 2,3-dioxygenase
VSTAVGHRTSTIGKAGGHTVSPGELQRAGYVAQRTPDPAAAAQFAVDHMGFTLVHVDSNGRHYLAAHGLDPYSLVYEPGDKAFGHVSFVVNDIAALDRQEARMRAGGAEVERIDPNPFWRAGPALRVMSPSGHEVHITPGVNSPVPMAARIVPNTDGPAPITHDHIGLLTTDIDAERKFSADVLGLHETARIFDPEGGLMVAFFRCHTLFHCYTIVAHERNDHHHMQFTLKNGAAVQAAYESMRDGGEVDVVWPPVRHGPGHNVAFYFRDGNGHFVEYSAEEEIIFDDAAYPVREWSTSDPNALDEWGQTAPTVMFQ